MPTEIYWHEHHDGYVGIDREGNNYYKNSNGDWCHSDDLYNQATGRSEGSSGLGALVKLGTVALVILTAWGVAGGSRGSVSTEESRATSGATKNVPIWTGDPASCPVNTVYVFTGDTLNAIENRSGVTVKNLIEHNKIDPNQLIAGWCLRSK